MSCDGAKMNIPKGHQPLNPRWNLKVISQNKGEQRNKQRKSQKETFLGTLFSHRSLFLFMPGF